MQQIKFYAMIGKTGLVNFFLQIKTTFSEFYDGQKQQNGAQMGLKCSFKHCFISFYTKIKFSLSWERLSI